MGDAKHTPGPWSAMPVLLHGEFDITATGGDEIACVYSSNGLDEPKIFPAEANSRLIAAAPDLLAACEALLEASRGGDVDAMIDGENLGRAAIAKATGAA